MKKFSLGLLCLFVLAVLPSCRSASPAQDRIMPAELTAEQQEIIDLLSIPNNQELILFDFSTEKAYRSFEIWVETYEYGELTDRPAGVGLHNDPAKALKGMAAVVICRNNLSYQWTLSVVEDGARYSHVGTAEFNIDSSYGNAFGPMNHPAAIETGKEIILYSSTFAESGAPHHAYDEQTLQERPELLEGFPVAFLIKCLIS